MCESFPGMSLGQLPWKFIDLPMVKFLLRSSRQAPGAILWPVDRYLYSVPRRLVAAIPAGTRSAPFDVSATGQRQCRTVTIMPVVVVVAEFQPNQQF